MKQKHEKLKLTGAAIASLTCIFSSPGLAQESSVSAFGGGLSVSDGFENRSFVGAFIDHYSDSGFGTHGEVSFVSREEDATFFAGGLSYGVSETFRPRIMVGTSSNNQNILPEIYLRGAIEIQSTPSEGILATPAVTYRSYRNGVDEVVPGLDVAYYLPPFNGDSYGVIQLIGSVSFVSPGDNVGFEIGGGASLVNPGFGTLGVTVTGGTMAYDTQLGVISVAIENDFWSVRPNGSIFIGENLELFVRGEFTSTDFYDISGGMGGLKLTY